MDKDKVDINIFPSQHLGLRTDNIMPDLLTDASDSALLRSKPGIKQDWIQILQGIGKHDAF